MGQSFVGIGERGFWVRDSVLELWLRLLALHFDDPVEPGARTARIRDQWLLASSGIFNGCVPDDLEEAVSTPEGEALVRKAIRSLMHALQKAPSHLSKDVLNLLGIAHGFWTQDVETRRLVEVGQAYLDLLDGKTPADPSFMPGNP